MTEPMLGEDEIARMRAPLWDQARAAYHDRRAADGDRLLDAAVQQWSSLKDYSINWITSLLTFVGEELGEAAVERALRKTGDEFVRPRRDTGTDWGSLPASARAKVIARAMVANMGQVDVSEDDEKIVLSFRCGTGGKLIDDGRYEGEHAYLTLRERAGRTFMREELPVYCAHCSVNNEIQPVEWGGAPTSIEHPPERPGEACVHHVYKDVRRIPPEAYERIGVSPPRDPSGGPSR
ncbi:MAG TPA: hypothetical protein VF152_07495 [Acidimicrobiia bacterium]